jgi:hypothetical protein
MAWLKLEAWQIQPSQAFRNAAIKEDWQLLRLSCLIAADVPRPHFFQECGTIDPGKNAAFALLLFPQDLESCLPDGGVPRIAKCRHEVDLPAPEAPVIT